jgi:multiple antibiotic resistance protein
MSEIATFAMLVFTSFFTIINPIGVMPLFMTMTADLPSKARKRTAIKATTTALITLLLFAFSGQVLFKFFGISIHSLRMVGGVIFFVMGYEMLQARLSRFKIDESQVKKYVDDISVTPLGIPMIAGPGAITNAIVLMQDANTIDRKLVLIGGLLSVLLIALLMMLSAGRLTRLMGETGNKIMMKLMGLIVMVIAVEFFFAGLGPMLKSIQ